MAAVPIPGMVFLLAVRASVSICLACYVFCQAPVSVVLSRPDTADRRAGVAERLAIVTSEWLLAVGPREEAPQLPRSRWPGSGLGTVMTTCRVGPSLVEQHSAFMTRGLCRRGSRGMATRYPSKTPLVLTPGATISFTGTPDTLTASKVSCWTWSAEMSTHPDSKNLRERLWCSWRSSASA